MICFVEGCSEPVLKRKRCRTHMNEYNRNILSRMRERSPELFKGYTLKRDYGIELIEYNLMFEAQGGACAICGTLAGTDSCNNNGSLKLSVDHDHSTGFVRALLCALCNKGVGSLMDDPTLLRKAADYIEFHKANPNKAIDAIRKVLSNN